jgi:hypothetical protein
MNVLFFGANQALGKLMRSHLYCSLDLDKNLVLDCLVGLVHEFFLWTLGDFEFCCNFQRKLSCHDSLRFMGFYQIYQFPQQLVKILRIVGVNPHGAIQT